MTQLFHPSTNTISRVSVFGGLFVVAGLFWAMGAVNRSPWVTQQNVVIDQPVPFSHRHHVAGLGLDCRFCHTAVEDSASAGLPATKTCMTCHSGVWTDAPILQPVRDSYALDRSIPWLRVHDLPDFVYFDHSIHLAKGVACIECHGRVDQMPLMWRENTLNMEWCLSCHRDPAPRLHPREELFQMLDGDVATEQHGSSPTESARARGERLALAHDVQPRTSCSACHR